MSQVKLIFTRDTLTQLAALKAEGRFAHRYEYAHHFGVDLRGFYRAVDRAGLRAEVAKVFPAKSVPAPKKVISNKQRDEIRRRYARGRTNAALAKTLNDENIAQRCMTSQGNVYSVSKGRRPKGMNPETFEKITELVKERRYHQRLADQDSAVKIGSDLKLNEHAVRNICNYLRQSDRVEAARPAIKGNPAWQFLTAPARNPGHCVGYY